MSGVKKWLWLARHAPRELFPTIIGRAFCRLLGWHGISCRGRTDHMPPKTDWHPVLRRFYL